MNSTKHPILLDTNHHFTTLVVWICHFRVMYGGTLYVLWRHSPELRSAFLNCPREVLYYKPVVEVHGLRLPGA